MKTPTKPVALPERRRRLSSRSEAPQSAVVVTPRLEDAETLFQKLTIAEIQEKRKEFYGGIETKRQELRLLVGKRYAGLIEVADGITEMKSCAESVTSSVSGLQQICQQLKKQQKSGAVISPAGDALPDSQREFYSITSQIKLLVTVAPKMFARLDEKSYSDAAVLFLLAKHLHQGLRLDTTAHNATAVLPFFPVISRHWPAIARFRQLIVASSRTQLSSPTLTADAAVDALLALVALEGVTVRQVFADFLLARTEALNQVLGSSSATLSVKDQLLQGISILILSLKLVFEIFTSRENQEPRENSLISRLALLSSSTSAVLRADVVSCCGSVVASHLPSSALEFKPALRGQSTPMPEEQMQDRCKKWFEFSLSTLRSSLSTQLAFVSSVMGLAHIRDVAFDALTDSDVVGDWDRASEELLGRRVCVWREAVRPLVVVRLEELVRDGMRNVVKGLVDGMKVAGATPSDDIISFMWSESSTDIPRINFGDGQKKDAGDDDDDESQLTMKTKGRTSKVQQLCQKADAALKEVLLDAQHFAIVKAKDDGATFDVEEDVSQASILITRCCHEVFQDLFSFLDEELAPPAHSSSRPHPRAARLVFFGRICEALSDQAPHLFAALVPSAALVVDLPQPSVADSSLKSSLRRSLHFTMRSSSTLSRSNSIGPGAHHHSDQTLFADVKEDLLKRFWLAWEAWRREVVDASLEEARGTTTNASMTSVLTSLRLTAWDVVEIKDEEGESEAEEFRAFRGGDDEEDIDETPVSSTSSLRVPSQSSPGLHRLLHRLCLRLNEFGGYVVPKSVVNSLVEDFLVGVVDVFKKLTTPRSEGAEDEEDNFVPMNQNLATQLVFDLRYLQQLLTHRGTTDSTRRRVDVFVSDLESSFIDPFDLDLLSSHLAARISRHVERTAGLYGLLTTAGARGGGSRGAGSTVMSHERAMALLLCGGSASIGARFQTIPMAASGGVKESGRRGASSLSPSSSRGRKSIDARGKETSPSSFASSIPKASTWSAGLSKLAAREGSNSPSDFFKSGAALYASWFGSAGGAVVAGGQDS